MKYIVLFLLFSFILQGQSNKEYDKLAQTAKEYFKNNTSPTRDKWIKLIESFEKFNKNAKDETYKAKAVYNISDLYYKLYKISKKSADLDNSIKNYENLCENYKESNLGDDGCKKLYEIYSNIKKDEKKAKEYAQFIMKNYPKSDSYSDAASFLGEKELEKEETEKNKDLKNEKFIKNNAVEVKIEENHIKIKITTRNNKTAVIEKIKKDNQLTKLYIELSNEKLILPPILIKNDIIEQIRFGEYKTGLSRIVFDLGKNIDYELIHEGKQLELVFKKIGTEVKVAEKKVDVKEEKKEETKKDVVKVEEKKEEVKTMGFNPLKENKEETKKDTAETSPAVKKATKEEKKVIVIDAGHGGNDPGATRSNIKEKDITLAVALKLQKKLNALKKYEVILTRDEDKYLSLDERTKIANENKGDIFISLHVNAISDTKFYGIETFYLNIAADNYSKRLEALENAETQKKISDLQFILADLLKKANTQESIQLSTYIQSSLVSNLRRSHKNIKDLGVKNAMFYVLLDTKMPSILVELGFITNLDERKQLLNEKYQNNLSESIIKGVENYFSKKTIVKAENK